MIGQSFWRRLRRVRLDQQAVREREIKGAEVEAAANLRRLTEERKMLEGRLTEARDQLTLVQEPEPLRLAKMVHLGWLAPLFLATLALAIWANLWGLEAFIGLDPVKRWIAAMSLPVFALLGGKAVGASLRMAEGTPLRRVYFGVGFAILVLALLGTVTINVVRGLDTARLEDARRASLASTEDLDFSEQPEADARMEAHKKRMGALFTVASVVMGVAGELGAAYAFDQLLLLMVPVWTVSRLRRRVGNFEEKLIQNAVEEEQARHHAELTRLSVAAEIIEVEEFAPQDEDKGKPKALVGDKPDESLVPLAWKILGVILAVLLILGWFLWRQAEAAEPLAMHTVVLVDLSASAGSQDEFAKNLRAVDGLINGVRETGGHRVAIFGITEASFGKPVLLVSTSPRDAGRYGEYLEEWQRSLMAEWRSVRSGLSPSAKGSDLFGAIARAGVELEGIRAAKKRLIILSDMRQVGRGFNFERSVADAKVLDQVNRQGLIPRLDGVEVWILGAHTAGMDERQWSRLKAFWAEYFRRAKADLKSFTPNRRLADQ